MTKKNIGTPLYTAPEILFRKDYSYPADVYSFAYIIYELFNREVAWKEKKMVWVIQAVCNDDIRPAIPDDCEISLATLMEQCWKTDPSCRPTFEQITLQLEAVRDKYSYQLREMNKTLEVGKNIPMTPKPIVS